MVSHEFAENTLFARRRAFHHEHVIDMSACSYNIYWPGDSRKYYASLHKARQDSRCRAKISQRKRPYRHPNNPSSLPTTTKTTTTSRQPSRSYPKHNNGPSSTPLPNPGISSLSAVSKSPYSTTPPHPTTSNPSRSTRARPRNGRSERPISTKNG
jgi:hypothetical protein